MIAIQKKLTDSFYILLSLPATAMGFALSVQISALSWILDTQYHLNLHEIGLVWAAGPLAGIIGQVSIGLLSDKVWFWNGRRRPFVLIGGTIAALMLLALPNIHHISSLLGITNMIIVATIVALTLDLAINISFNPTRSVIADVTPEGEKRTKGYTWMQTISGFFGVLAYLIGAFWGNYVLISFGVGFVLLFSIVPMFFIEEPKSLNQKTENYQKTKVHWGELMMLFTAHGFSWIGVQTMFVFIIAYIKQEIHPTSDAQTGQIISISFAVLNTVGFLLPALVLEPMTKRMNRVKVHTISIAIMSLGYFGIIVFAKSAIALYGLMMVLGIGWSAIVSLPFAILSEKVDKTRMGFFMGIFNLSVVLPQLFVSLVMSKFINDAPDKNFIFVVCGVSLTISAVLWNFVKERKAQ